MSDPQFLAWVDLETTGTDESDDLILEVALLVTFAKPMLDDQVPWRVLPDGERSWVVETPAWERLRLLDKMRANETVQRMHSGNGLLSDTLFSEDATPIQRVDVSLCEVLSFLGRRGEFMLAGSGVSHFDRRFINTHLPLFASWLQYPNFDVGVVRRFLRAVNPELVPPSGDVTVAGRKTHRALDDIRVHLGEANHYARLLAPRLGPSTLAVFSGLTGEREEV